jgi:lysophospholipase L1-like esterase
MPDYFRFGDICLHTKITLALAFAFALSVLPASAAKPDQRWVGSWAAAPTGAPAKIGEGSLQESTLREIVRLSIGGSSVRIVVSNEFGTDPLTVDGASIALSAGGGTIKPGTAQMAQFDGKPSITIPGGAMVLSDPIAMPVAPLSNLAVSLYVSEQKMSMMTRHDGSQTTNYIAKGNQLTAATMEDAKSERPWMFLKGVDVLAGDDAATIVALGDSITDGATSMPDANDRWPNFLANRLQANKKFAHLGVLNEGISGNRLLRDGAGQSALARLDRDVIAQAGVKYLIILESINDIGGAFNPMRPHDPVTAEQLIQGLTQIIDRAHLHGIKVIGATLTPYVGAGYSSPAGEEAREKVNEFIRNSGKFDAVVDFEKVIADPQNPKQILPAYNVKDHLHPNDAGYKALGDSIDLKLFR